MDELKQLVAALEALAKRHLAWKLAQETPTVEELERWWLL